ncbi:Os10g0170601 [Oryza sativa Japonica Group]|uniref:Os10g0170601 protein n=1 Tax=Oryza sativa subsp. japonica TaxID=39947 RepID=A0A0P0XSW6_ORYSJ|nr:Os10g0170601 [Oryza sativa Japonica Group]
MAEEEEEGEVPFELAQMTPYESGHAVPRWRQRVCGRRRCFAGATQAAGSAGSSMAADTTEAWGGRRSPPRGKEGVGVAAVVGEELEGRGPDVAVARQLPPSPISSPRLQTAPFRSAGRSPAALRLRFAPPSTTHSPTAALLRRPPRTRTPPALTAAQPRLPPPVYFERARRRHRGNGGCASVGREPGLQHARRRVTRSGTSVARTRQPSDDH